MRKLRVIMFAIVGVLATAMTALAQAPGPTPEPFKSMAEIANHEPGVLKYKAIAAVFGFAIAVFGGALGQSRIAAAAVEGAARNPGAAGKIQMMMILGLALIESLVLFALVITFMKA